MRRKKEFCLFCGLFPAIVATGLLFGGLLFSGDDDVEPQGQQSTLVEGSYIGQR